MSASKRIREKKAAGGVSTTKPDLKVETKLPDLVTETLRKESKGPSSSSAPATVVPMLRSVIGSRLYRMHFGWAASFTTLATGQVNYISQNNQLPVLAEFTSAATLFDEFFVESMRLEYHPISRYQFIPTAGPSTTLSSVPFAAVPLYHNVGQYTSMVAAMNCPAAKVGTTADPFVITWRNNEDARAGVLVSPTTVSPTPTQGWCLTASAPAALYLGQVQFISSVNAGDASIKTLGQVFYRWSVLMRIRA
jgi:hypothetical protein